MIDYFAQTLGQNLPKVEANQATLNGVLNTIYGVVGALAIIFIIVSGIRYTLSGGDANKVAQAKAGISAAIIGLVVVVFAYSITNFIIGTFAANDFNGLRQNIVNTLGFLAGAIAVIMIIYGALQYVTSGGGLGDGKSPGKVQKAKSTILNAVIGLVIVIAAYAIVNFVLRVIG